MGDGLHCFFEQPKGVMCQWPEAPCNSCCLGKNITISATSRRYLPNTLPPGPWTIVPRAKKLKSTHLGVEQKHQVRQRTGLAVHVVGVEPGQDQTLFLQCKKQYSLKQAPSHGTALLTPSSSRSMPLRPTQPLCKQQQ